METNWFPWEVSIDIPYEHVWELSYKIQYYIIRML